MLKDLVKTGTKFFVDHGTDNSHEDRKPVGEVIASGIREISGVLSNIIVGHFPNKDDVKDLDVCSMEANIQTENDVVSDVDDISGIALGNSDVSHPAFAGATRLATVQCFIEKDAKPKENREMADEPRELTFDQVLAGVKKLNVFPWQLFDLETMKKDTTYGKIFTENARLTADNERLTGELKTTTDKSAEAVKQADIASAGTRIDTILGEGHTQKQIAFIKGRFNPDKVEDLTDEGLKKFVEQGEKEFAETVKLLGVTDTSSTTPAAKKEGEPDETGDDLEAEALKLIGVT